MSMITSSTEIIPGNTYYHVYGYRGKETTDAQIYQIQVIGVNVNDPVIDINDNSCISYRNSDNSHIRYQSINDMGIDCTPYNMNRLFSTIESAKDFVLRLQQDMITYDEMKYIHRGEIIQKSLFELIDQMSKEFDIDDEDYFDNFDRDDF